EVPIQVQLRELLSKEAQLPNINLAAPFERGELGAIGTEAEATEVRVRGHSQSSHHFTGWNLEELNLIGRMNGSEHLAIGAERERIDFGDPVARHGLRRGFPRTGFPKSQDR